jgi:hypothetical protein
LTVAVAAVKRNLRQKSRQEKTCCQEEIGSEKEERRQKGRRWIARKEGSCEKSCKEKRRQQEKVRQEKEIVRKKV